MADLVGRTIGHYRVGAAIGAGGMGEVYRATDTRLDREVALKVLPPEMAARSERLERFRREAKALAALDHPGIVTVYSVEEAEGLHFLTMQLVEGEPLERLIPEGGLPAARLVAIASALAEAIATAHGRGIVHRDLKPANVMVTGEGRVKVLDFGLARMDPAAADPRASSELATDVRTSEGVVVGTMPYMSPEQLSGREVDARSDVFSLGVVLYEVACGQRPFQGSSSAELASAILRDAPPSLGEQRADLPGSLLRVIERCLSKEPAARFASAGELRDALAAASKPRSPATLAALSDAAAADSGAARARDGFWVAVLPFKTLGGDPEIEAFADGLGEDITTGLSRFQHLHVVARESALRHAGRALDGRETGRALGARYAVQGTVRKAGTTLRISVQLVDTSTGTHLWADSYDRDLSAAGIFAVLDDVTDRVVATVADPYGVLVRSMAAALRDKPLDALSASELVLLFFVYWHQIRADEHARLRGTLERRLEREPAHADGWACLGRLYSHEHGHNLNPLPDSLLRARRAAQRAVEIDPACQMGWETLADASFHLRDIDAFRPAAERALALNPRNTTTMAGMAVFYALSGDAERGTALARRAMDLNPHHPGWYHIPLIYDHFRREEYEQALAATKRMNMPGFFWTHVNTVAACGRLSRRSDARAALEALRGLFPGYRDELRRYEQATFMEPAIWSELMRGLEEAEALAGPAPSNGSAGSS
jgi:TolB-like protein